MPSDCITARHLKDLAHHYNTKDFISCDPIQFPHRYTDKKDIEISAFVTAWISWGNRKQIIRTAQHLHTNIFNDNPYNYLKERKWEQYRNSPDCFYRTVRYGDFHSLMERLYNVYSRYDDLEDCVAVNLDTNAGNPALALSTIFRNIAGIADASKKSPCKRLWFFLRWMVRRDNIVDIGIWKKLSPDMLIIPLDTHVYHVALKLGLTNRRSADITTARQITDFFKKIFPDDPALGDFALFGYGIEKGI